MSDQRILGRDDFFKGVGLKRELVEVPELGENAVVWVQELSTEQLLTYNKRVQDIRDSGVDETSPQVSLELISLIASYSIVDSGGNPMFTLEEMKRIANSKLMLVARLSVRSLEISGLNPALATDLTSEVAANLKKVQTNSSSSSSPKSSRKRKRKS